MKGMGAVAVSFVLAAATAGVHAGVISDATFFTSISHTLISFEYYADGSPVVLGEGETTIMYYDEYRYTDGVWFEYTPHGYLDELTYGNDSGADTEAAQSIGGSLEIAIPSPTVEKFFAMIFDVPVRAFGYWVVDRNTITAVPVFTAKNSSGAVLETVTFQGALVDGTIGVADYGFMGIWATQDIARVEMSQDGSLYDNLTFSGVPEPTGLALLAVGAAAVLRRRRRR